MDEAARGLFARFGKFRQPNTSNVVRHRMIDDALRERLAAAPESRVLLIGAGFDTRAYRLSGGRWVEFDEPELIALKNARLPVAEAPNELIRVPVAFDSESLAERLAPFGTPGPVLVVVEGVLVYLREAQVRALAQAILRICDRPTLLCDLLTPQFTARYGGPLRRELAELGAEFQVYGASPLEVLEQEGFRLRQRESIVARSNAVGRMPLPRWVLNVFFRTLRDGYTLATLDADPDRAHPR